MPLPAVILHITERRTDTALSGYSVTAGGKNFSNARRAKTGSCHTKRRSKTSAACTYNNHIMNVIDDFIRISHFDF
jgi:hypothetical protein